MARGKASQNVYQKLIADLSSANIPFASWTQLNAALGSDMNELRVSNTSPQVLELGYGPAGSEVGFAYVASNQSMEVPIHQRLNAGMRFVVRARTADAVEGALVINGYL
jgi:hypothetical protein